MPVTASNESRRLARAAIAAAFDNARELLTFEDLAMAISASMGDPIELRDLASALEDRSFEIEEEDTDAEDDDESEEE
jgi:hypothetical protein